MWISAGFQDHLFRTILFARLSNLMAAGATSTLSSMNQPSSSKPTPPPHPARRIIGAVLSLALPIIVWFVPLPLDLTAKHALAVACFMIVAWITEVLPHAVTGIIGCYLFWVLKVPDSRLPSAVSPIKRPGSCLAQASSE